MQRRFKVILEWDKEAKVYVVTVPALPGCSTFGRSREEALEMAKDAIQVTLEGLKAIGQPVPTEDKDVSLAEVVLPA
ncbi:MAG: type II toxin-antitoxin system HicB family antitoxin [Bacillota bacterium]|uniref:type II toxin-antitoxin system HicB family antitoxin n=1 Tax=Desulfurispora thermophila TaxID=265470 RepID=UPI00036AB0E1|nr:type II toxin-antitoxin system HicB family antitoxin [Desulfurispora thermophila]